MANIQFVDVNDEPIGAGSKEEARENGIRHRISKVFLVNTNGDVLLQKRADHLALEPGLWAVSAAGHIDEGETYEDAAIRELKEELGVTNLSLTEIGYYYQEEDGEQVRKRFNRIYVGKYDGEVTPNPEEVSEVKWISKTELNDLTEKRPEEFTQGCLRTLKFVWKLL
jgi:isopentenyl-diphosphate delta-isomerase type 1